MSIKKQDQPRSQRICIGKIATAHGVKGLVKILVYADNPQILNGKIYAAESGDSSLDITIKNPLGKYWLAAIKSINDRNEAEAIRGTKLWADRTSFPEANEAEDEFYIHDLVGLPVFDSEQNEIATITAIDNYGAGDLLELTLPTGESFLLPFTKENVPNIDISTGHVTVGDIRPYLILAN